MQVDVKQADDVKTDDQPKVKTQEEIRAEVEAELSSKYKNEIAGLNRSYADLKKKAEELENKGLSAEELAKKNLEIAETAKKEARNFERSLTVDRALHDAGLPLEFAKRIMGETEDEIKNDVIALKKYLGDEVTKKVSEEVNKKLAGDPPKVGDSTGKKTMTLNEFNQLDSVAKAKFMASGGTLKD